MTLNVNGETKYEEWIKHNEYESKWWGDCVNTSDEEAKQLEYAKYLGLDQYKIEGFLGGNFDLKGKSVLDIGGGPVSLLLKCRNRTRSVVLDPADFPQWVIDRYNQADVELVPSMAESNMSVDSWIGQGRFDEVWIYNVLQHTYQPNDVVETAKKYGKIVRVFEWINTEKNMGHPNSFTKEELDKMFGKVGQTVQLAFAGRSTPLAYYNVIEYRDDLSPVVHDVAVPDGQFTFHLLGLAHLPTRREISTCAYTQKVVKLASMLKSLGHKIYFYGVENSEVECDENIVVLTEDQRRKVYGDYDWWKEFFKHDGNDLAYTTFAKNAVTEIKKRSKPTDILLIPMGNYQKYVADNAGIMAVESGIGYTGIFSPYKVFESQTWMHYVYGLTNQGDGSWYDSVIPNYYNPDDFEIANKRGDYYLFMGRVVQRKGVSLAAEITQALGAKLIIAGQGGLKNNEVNLTGYKHIEYVGAVGPEQRKALMSGAIATIMPTYYIEPFGGVAVESMMSGTPVITTDWGVFSETIVDHVTGFRCRTFAEFLWAGEQVKYLDPIKIREWAVKNYAMDRVRHMYHEYFQQVSDLFDPKGWYRKRDIKDVNRYQKWYPSLGE